MKLFNKKNIIIILISVFLTTSITTAYFLFTKNYFKDSKEKIARVEWKKYYNEENLYEIQHPPRFELKRDIGYNDRIGTVFKDVQNNSEYGIHIFKASNSRDFKIVNDAWLKEYNWSGYLNIDGELKFGTYKKIKDIIIDGIPAILAQPIKKDDKELFNYLKTILFIFGGSLYEITLRDFNNLEIDKFIKNFRIVKMFDEWRTYEDRKYGFRFKYLGNLDIYTNHKEEKIEYAKGGHVIVDGSVGLFDSSIEFNILSIQIYDQRFSSPQEFFKFDDEKKKKGKMIEKDIKINNRNVTISHPVEPNPDGTFYGKVFEKDLQVGGYNATASYPITLNPDGSIYENYEYDKTIVFVKNGVLFEIYDRSGDSKEFLNNFEFFKK